MFATLETLILRERGGLNLYVTPMFSSYQTHRCCRDDPVIKFLPNFTHRPFGWREYLDGTSQEGHKYNLPVTLRQLATHMSGIGRDYPPFNVPRWPYLTTSNRSSLQGHLMTISASPWADPDAMKQAIARYPLIVPPYSYPIYSNTGFGVLGWCNVVAAKRVNKTSPNTYAELLQRDIFTPLHMKGSSFLASDLRGDHLAFPSMGDEVVRGLPHSYPLKCILMTIRRTGISVKV
jgi:CubicO group peptidase (beta-lactamase class C family)